MANEFNKEERVAFEQILEGFNDALVMSSVVTKYSPGSATEMQRQSETIWRPQPYIAASRDGLDQTGNAQDFTQLSVPATLSNIKSVPWTMDVLELRDALNEGRLGKAASQRLASDINTSLTTIACALGSITVDISTAASGYDDVALAQSAMVEQGVDMMDAKLVLAQRDYNGMASNLAARETINEMPTQAFRESYVGRVAKFETFATDTATRLTAAAGTSVTINGANQYYTPVSVTSSPTTDERLNVDNRFQTLAITVGGGTVKVGDRFTIAGVNSVHHITKQDTGQLKTFVITEIVTGSGGTGTVKITPPIISNGGGTDAEEQYQNVTATPANGANITFLNTQDAYINPFFKSSAVELLPGRLAVPSGQGAAVMRGTTDQGIELVWQKQYNAVTGVSFYRADVFYGTCYTNTEFGGVILFGQT